jgi:hypothetical protein
MTEYEVFEIYKSLKLHFNQESFDFFKYHGKSKVSLKAFEKRKDKWHFIKLSKKFNNVDHCISFIVANLLEDSQTWVGNLLLDEADVIYTNRQKIVQSLSYTFENDCRKLFEGVKNPNDLLKVVNGDYPILLTKTMQKVTQIETFCLLSKILGFLPMWKEKINDTIVWPNFYMKTLKYASFLPKEEMKYKMILKKIIT